MQATKTFSKHTLPVQVQPLIRHSLSTLMLAGIKELLVTVDLKNGEHFSVLLGDVNDLGINIELMSNPDQMAWQKPF